MTGKGTFKKLFNSMGIIQGNLKWKLFNQHLETAGHMLLKCEALRCRRLVIFGPNRTQKKTSDLARQILGALTNGIELS